MEWLIFLPQLPASPSTLRVMVWRRMRAAGALGLQNGVWILTHTPEQRQFADELHVYLKDHDASSYIFVVNTLSQSIEEDILEQMRAERDEEYVEFCERCEALIVELERERGQEKFTFAELEETGEDLQKLENWWGKISARDFVGGGCRQEAFDRLEFCQAAYRAFASEVYARQGIDTSDDQDL